MSGNFMTSTVTVTIMIISSMAAMVSGQTILSGKQYLNGCRTSVSIPQRHGCNALDHNARFQGQQVCLSDVTDVYRDNSSFNETINDKNTLGGFQFR